MIERTRTILVHGGAWSIPPEAHAAHEVGCLAAAERGFAVLAERSVQGRAGLIVLDRHGQVGLAHSTRCLAHAYRRTGMPAAAGGTEVRPRRA